MSRGSRSLKISFSAETHLRKDLVSSKMQRLTIFAALVSVASAQYRQFRTTEQDAAETSAAAAAATAAAPSKFEGLVNVTWNPEWTGPFNFSELQESVGDKFDLASLAGSQVMSGLNLVPNLFSNASISAVLTAVNGYAGYTVANAYNLVATVVFPATVTVILFAGVIYIVQVAIQMAGFVVQSKVSVLQLVGEALAGLQDVLGGKFGGHDRKGRAPEIPDSPELLALAANVFKAIEAYSNL